MEIYKQLDNYQNYEISNFGNILNKKTGHILSKGSEKHRYQYVSLVDNDGKNKSESLHLLVAKTFIQNPENKPQVNHIDRNKKNNNVNNLEWVTESENQQHVVKTGKKVGNTINKKCKVTLQNGEIKVFKSLKETSDYFGVPKESLSLAAKKEDKTYRSRIKKNLIFKIEIIEDTYDDNLVWYTIDINGFKHLEITKSAIIRNKKTKKEVKGFHDERYIRITCDKENGNKSISVHRIIALLFIDNPENKKYVNHIDGNTFNNSVENLEWVTHSENIKHAVDNGLIDFENRKKAYRKIYQLELNGKILNKFDGIVNAEKYLENHELKQGQSISIICSLYRKGKYQTSSGYGWCYIDDYKEQTVSDSLKNIFPELVGRNNVDYDVIRKYIINISRPIWQIDLDGTRINKFDSINAAAIALKLNVTNINVYMKNSEYLVSGYSFRYVSYDDMINPESYKIKNIPDKIKNIFKIEDDSTFIHPKIIKLLKENISKNGDFAIKTAPVIQETLDGKYINVFPNASKARQSLGFGRETVEAVLRGKNSMAGGFFFRYLKLDDPVLDLI